MTFTMILNQKVLSSLVVASCLLASGLAMLEIEPDTGVSKSLASGNSLASKSSLASGSIVGERKRLGD